MSKVGVVENEDAAAMEKQSLLKTSWWQQFTDLQALEELLTIRCFRCRLADVVDESEGRPGEAERAYAAVASAEASPAAPCSLSQRDSVSSTVLRRPGRYSTSKLKLKKIYFDFQKGP